MAELESSIEKHDFTVSPDAIDATKHFWGAFNNMETEVSAGYIMRLLQKKGGWVPFTLDEIEEEYRTSGHEDGFRFNRLIHPESVKTSRGGWVQYGGGWVVEKDGEYSVTEEFVNRVHRSSPVSS